jgi:hypothetical protein
MVQLAQTVTTGKDQSWWYTVDGEKAGEELGRIFAQYIGRPLTPLRIVGDIAGAFDHEAALIRDNRQYTGEGFGERLASGFGETMQSTLYAPSKMIPFSEEIGLFDSPQPPRYSATRELPAKRTGTLFKQVLGLTGREPRREYEKELTRLGLDEWEMYTKTGEGKYDNEMRKEIGALVAEYLPPLVDSERYFNRSDTERIATIKNYLNKIIKPIARAKVKSTLYSVDTKVMGRKQWRSLTKAERRLANDLNFKRYGKTVEQMKNYEEGVALGNSSIDTYW